MYDEFVHYSFIDKCWVIHPNDVNDFLNKYKHLDIPIETHKLNIVRYDKALDDIGKSMKLRPYIYQREAIKFVLDNNNALLILPCGAGIFCRLRL